MMHNKLLLAAIATAFLTSCTSLGREYGQRSTKVTLTTQSQVDLTKRAIDGASEAARQEELLRLAATVYTMTWREWQRMDGATLLRELREAELGDAPDARSAAALRLATALLRYRRGEGKTPLVLTLPIAIHMVVAERDGRYEAVEFHPQRQNTAVVGL